MKKSEKDVPKYLVIGRQLVMGLSTLDVMNPDKLHQTKQPAKGKRKNKERARERTQV
jgi:hypothetical protein